MKAAREHGRYSHDGRHSRRGSSRHLHRHLRALGPARLRGGRPGPPLGRPLVGRGDREHLRRQGELQEVPGPRGIGTGDPVPAVDSGRAGAGSSDPRGRHASGLPGPRGRRRARVRARAEPQIQAGGAQGGRARDGAARSGGTCLSRRPQGSHPPGGHRRRPTLAGGIGAAARAEGPRVRLPRSADAPRRVPQSRLGPGGRGVAGPDDRRSPRCRREAAPARSGGGRGDHDDRRLPPNRI